MARVAVVTGAGQGIGRGIAEVLAERGWQVVACDINEPAAKETASVVGGAYAAFDVSDPEQVAVATREIVKAHGPVHALVNNAGWDKLMPFSDTNLNFWQKVIGINLLGPMAVTHGLLPSIIETHGRIVNIASDAGRVGSKGEVVYSGAKAGVIGFTRALAREMARHTVTVNVVCPGPTNTPLNREAAADNPKLMDSLKRAIPLARAHDRIGEPADIAYAVAFLCSDEAEWVTGQTLSVSGGLVIG